jgi:hypothetical protein
MKLLVVTATFYDRDYDQKLYRLKYSAEKFGIDLKTYGGPGEVFNFFDSKIVKLGNFLNNHKDEYTHALYTDAADSFFLSGLDEIIAKYERMGSRLVVSAEKNCHPFGHLADKFLETGTSYRYMNPGNFIGAIPHLLEVFSHLRAFPHLKTDDQGHWYEALLDERITVTLDSKCQLFQTMSDTEFYDEFRFTKNGRVQNLETGSFPAIVHFNGPKGEGTRNEALMRTVFDYFKENSI